MSMLPVSRAANDTPPHYSIMIPRIAAMLSGILGVTRICSSEAVMMLWLLLFLVRTLQFEHYASHFSAIVSHVGS